jgi:hypothetical protein
MSVAAIVLRTAQLSANIERPLSPLALLRQGGTGSTAGHCVLELYLKGCMIVLSQLMKGASYERASI